MRGELGDMSSASLAVALAMALAMSRSCRHGGENRPSVDGRREVVGLRAVHVANRLIDQAGVPRGARTETEEVSRWYDVGQTEI